MKAALGWIVGLGALSAGAFLALRGGGRGLSGSRRRVRGLRGPHEVRELRLFIDNDGDLYRQQYTPILKNLVTKKARGVYDRTKAEKLWMYLVESGAKKYAREHGSPGTPWHVMFPISDRREVAKELNNHFLAEDEYGNYDHLLPKKYRKKA